MVSLFTCWQTVSSREEEEDEERDDNSSYALANSMRTCLNRDHLRTWATSYLSERDERSFVRSVRVAAQVVTAGGGRRYNKRGRGKRESSLAGVQVGGGKDCCAVHSLHCLSGYLRSFQPQLVLPGL